MKKRVCHCCKFNNKMGVLVSEPHQTCTNSGSGCHFKRLIWFYTQNRRTRRQRPESECSSSSHRRRRRRHRHIDRPCTTTLYSELHGAQQHHISSRYICFTVDVIYNLMMVIFFSCSSAFVEPYYAISSSTVVHYSAHFTNTIDGI